MKCPECGYTTAHDDLSSCPRCGADWLSAPDARGIEARPPDATAPLELPAVTGREENARSWTFPSEERPREKTDADRSAEVRWGGFWRRLSAFSIDLVILELLSALLFYFSYLGYSVGLAAHGRAVTWESLNVFVRIILFAWLSLGAGYFVLFHGMDGRTIGKWLLGLRVVGANRSAVTYRQALVRSIGFIPSVISCLGILRILWNREKRGWHDSLARTWVIRE